MYGFIYAFLGVCVFLNIVALTGIMMVSFMEIVGDYRKKLGQRRKSSKEKQ